MIRFLNIKNQSLIIAVILSIVLSACRDDLLYDNSIIGEGEATLSATVSFNPMGTGLDTRSDGDAVKNINNLCVLIYSPDGKLVDSFIQNQFTDYVCKQDGNSAYPDDAFPGNISDTKYDNPSESSTPKATFKLENIPYGRYRMYAVANMGDLATSTDIFRDKNGKTVAIKDAIQTEEGLKGIKLSWKTDVAQDNAMFGFFTTDSDKKSMGFEGQLITVSEPVVNLHCWIKRTISKVTIAFDPSGLKEAVTVYIRSVTIHDIPNECYLGETNKPDNDSQLIKDGETIYYGDGETDAVSYEQWMKLQKGTGVQGSKDHKENDDALYFFENMQGDFQGQEDFYKPQIAAETGESINEPAKDENGNILQNENGIMKTDFKDRVPYGTYIEVEGYYVSKNKEKISNGPIKYRFMLGKNITYNYDAERNYHYKLTLKFRGWANEADWHIVYDELTPTIFAPDKYYISYLYNQSMTLPIRLAGLQYIQENNLHLHAQIIENNWVPTYSIEENNKLAPAEMGGYDNLNGMAWNEWSYEHIYKGENYAGFLSLRENQQTIVGNDQTYGPAGNEYLKKNYEGIINVSPRYYAYYKIPDESKEGLDVCEDAIDGKYDVVMGDDNSVTLNLPMFTRPKELIPSTDFSGNNPYYAYVRKAVVRFSLRKEEYLDINPSDSKESGYEDIYNWPFKVKTADGKESNEVKYVDVPIYQVPRIVNPKGIWRRSNNADAFHVQLMQLDEAGSDTFEMFESDGPWRASILQDPDGLIQLTMGNQTVTNSSSNKYIEGETGTNIDFTYTPRGTIGDNDCRCGIILVEYHDYTCNHLIFVRQGYDKGVELGGKKWSCYSAVASGKEPVSRDPDVRTNVDVVVTNSPLSIGSLFKRCQYDYAILEKNNEELGWLVDVKEKDLITAYVKGTGFDTKNYKWSYFGGFGWTSYNDGSALRHDRKWADTWNVVNKKSDPLTVPTYEDFQRLRDECQYGYGVVYADGATETKTNVDEAYGYTNYDNEEGKNSEYGMRACILYNDENGDQILFPIGAEGQGRRARTASSPKYYAGSNSATGFLGIIPEGANYLGSLTYSGLGGLLYTNPNSSTDNNYRPLTYNIYREPGAVYWFKEPILNKTEAASDGDPRVASWDINYYTLVFNPYNRHSLGDAGKDGVLNDNGDLSKTTDALPIRFIYK